MAERSFDVIVLGAGPAGEVAARPGWREAGLSVALVERELVGGECSFWACMPSKALLRPAELLAEVRRVPGAAQAVTGELDVRRHAGSPGRGDPRPGRLRARCPGSRAEASSSCAATAGSTASGACGSATTCWSADRAVVVATGSAALIPPIDGLREARPWTNREVTTAKEAPRRLAILGGGVVGRRDGAGVAQPRQPGHADRGGRPLISREEDFAGEQVAEALARGRRGRAARLEGHCGVAGRETAR